MTSSEDADDVVDFAYKLGRLKDDASPLSYQVYASTRVRQRRVQ